MSFENICYMILGGALTILCQIIIKVVCYYIGKNRPASEITIPKLKNGESHHHLMTLWISGRDHYLTTNGFYLAGSTFIFLGIVELMINGKYNCLSLSASILGIFLCFQWFITTWRQAAQLNYWVKILKAEAPKDQDDHSKSTEDKNNYDTGNDMERIFRNWKDLSKTNGLFKNNCMKIITRIALCFGDKWYGWRARLMPFIVGLLFIATLVFSILIIAYPTNDQIKPVQSVVQLSPQPLLRPDGDPDPDDDPDGDPDPDDDPDGDPDPDDDPDDDPDPDNDPDAAAGEVFPEQG